MIESDSVHSLFSDDPMGLDGYWVHEEHENPDIYVLNDPAEEWSAVALADGEVTLYNFYDCLNADGEPDTCEQELFIEQFPTFFYRLLNLYQRCEGYFDNDVWQK